MSMKKAKSDATKYRVQLRGKILEAALDMFRKYGLKAVKMDDISKSMGISKRTLYEIYPNKEELVYEAIKYRHQTSREELIANIAKTSGDTMDVLIEFFRMHMKQSIDTNPVLIEDIHLYPKVKEFLESNRKEHASHVDEFFRKGQEEGYFIKDLNFEVYHHINNAVTDYFISHRIIGQYSLNEVLYAMICAFVRGICTAKGIARVEELLKTVKG